VTKRELMARAWPNIVVEEGNLKVHVAALRKALGEGQPGARYVATISGRGYRFVASVRPFGLDAEPTLQSSAAPRAHNLPSSPTRTIGRAATVDALRKQLPQSRFVTVVGPGGIGKTTVALAAAESLVGDYEDGTHFVDLAPLQDPHFVPSAI